MPLLSSETEPKLVESPTTPLTSRYRALQAAADVKLDEKGVFGAKRDMSYEALKSGVGAVAHETHRKEAETYQGHIDRLDAERAALLIEARTLLESAEYQAEIKRERDRIAATDAAERARSRAENEARTDAANAALHAQRVAAWEARVLVVTERAQTIYRTISGGGGAGPVGSGHTAAILTAAILNAAGPYPS